MVVSNWKSEHFWQRYNHFYIDGHNLTENSPIFNPKPPLESSGPALDIWTTSQQFLQAHGALIGNNTVYIVMCQRGGVSNKPPWLQSATRHRPGICLDKVNLLISYQNWKRRTDYWTHFTKAGWAWHVTIFLAHLYIAWWACMHHWETGKCAELWSHFCM